MTFTRLRKFHHDLCFDVKLEISSWLAIHSQFSARNWLHKHCYRLLVYLDTTACVSCSRYSSLIHIFFRCISVLLAFRSHWYCLCLCSHLLDTGLSAIDKKKSIKAFSQCLACLLTHDTGNKNGIPQFGYLLSVLGYCLVAKEQILQIIQELNIWNSRSRL